MVRWTTTVEGLALQIWIEACGFTKSTHVKMNTQYEVFTTPNSAIITALLVERVTPMEFTKQVTSQVMLK